MNKDWFDRYLDRILVIALLIICVSYVGYVVYEKATTECALYGCSKKRWVTGKYCYTHYKEYDSNYVPNESKVCSASGCSLHRTKYSIYCVNHCCDVFECTHQTAVGQYYCEIHTCVELNCNNIVFVEKSTCDSCVEARKKANAEFYAAYQKSKKSKNKMPDCDDYWDEDEFLDDWDCKIPGGMDAEDYWDNW